MMNDRMFKSGPHGFGWRTPVLWGLALVCATSVLWLSAQTVLAHPFADDQSDNCRVVGHPGTDRFSEDASTGNDHHDIAGEEPDDVTFRLGVPYEFTIVGDECEPLDDPARLLTLNYLTADVPYSGHRDGLLNLPDGEGAPRSMLVMAIYTGGSEFDYKVRDDITVADEYTAGGFSSVEDIADAMIDSGNNSLSGFSFCSTPASSMPPGAKGTQVMIDRRDVVDPPDGRGNPATFRGNIMGNYDLRLHGSSRGYNVSTFDTDPNLGLLLTFCSRGQGFFWLSENSMGIDGHSDSHDVRVSPVYRVRYSRLAVQMDRAPGGPVAAQVLLTLISGLLFWAGAGPVLGGFSGRGSNPMQPFAGLVGMVIGAMALPVFGYGDWFWAGLLIVIAILVGFLYAAMISR